MTTLAPAPVYRCPCCKGEPIDTLCFCDGRGVLTGAQALEWQADSESLERVPEPPEKMLKPCVDCAFRADSPERDGCGRTWQALRQSAIDGVPFYCHQGMLVSASGSYLPLRQTPAGTPIGHPICAGWLAAREKLERSR